MPVLELDGSAAGGQFLRTALGLAAVTDTPVVVEGVRGDRPDPGLKPQHLAAVEALAAFCDATVEGAEVGAETVAFDPGPLRPGAQEVAVGTAGSISLVFDAVLPLAIGVDAALSLTATGGTEVAWSPPLAYLDHVKLPFLRRHGVQAAVERERTGFYPAGGGQATLHLGPSDPTSLDLTSRGDGRGVDVVSIASEGLRDAEVAERQAAAARDRIEDTGLSIRHVTTMDADAESPGTAVLVALDYAETRAGFTALGEQGKPAEDVGEEAAEAALEFHEGQAVVDRHMANQLLVVLALTGGTVLVPAVTDHVAHSVDVLEAFGASVAVSEAGPAVRLAVEQPL